MRDRRVVKERVGRRNWCSIAATVSGMLMKVFQWIEMNHYFSKHLFSNLFNRDGSSQTHPLLKYYPPHEHTLVTT